MKHVNVIGAGLAGSEAAWQIAQAGIQVHLYEMRPVKMTDAHHNTPECHQRRRRKTKFLGAKQRRDRDITTGLELAVRFYSHAAAQIVEHERLVSFSQTKFPR